MASFDKYKATSVGALLRHNNRTQDDNAEHSNEEIDLSRTIENYYLKKGSAEALNQRLDEIFCTGRRDQIVLGEICVTLPQDVEPKDERVFFQSVYDFFCEDFGERNIINAVVHKDETKPHLHLDFVPTVTSEMEYDTRNKLLLAEWKIRHSKRLEELEEEYGKPVIERLCCKELITRAYLNTMHERLSTHVSKDLGYECAILNGATAQGNKHILELKAASLRKEVEMLERQKKLAEKEIETIQKVAAQSGIPPKDIGLLPLMQKIADLERQNKVFRNIIAENRYKYSQAEIAQLQKRQYFPALSARVNVFDGQLNDIEIEKNGIVLIELYDKVARPLPQQKYIDSEDDLRSQVRMLMQFNNGSPFIVRSSRTSEKSYMYLRTDNSKQTVMALFEMEQHLKQQEEQWQGRKIYMERLSNDEHDIARSILDKSSFDTIYLTGRELGDRDSKELTLQKT